MESRRINSRIGAWPHEWVWNRLKRWAPEMFDSEAAAQAVQEAMEEHLQWAQENEHAWPVRQSAWPFTSPTPTQPTPQEAAQGRMCFFHPDRPAVAAEGFAAMCPQCYERWQATHPNTQRQADYHEAESKARLIMHASKTAASWDPTICEHCLHPTTEPRKFLNGKWYNSCTNCGATREVPTSSPLLKQQLQNWPPYPALLDEVATKSRPWISTGKIAELMYHVAPTRLRKTIQNEGLNPQGPQMNESGHEPGVYLWDTPEAAATYRAHGDNMYRDMDIHAVDTDNTKLLPDRFIWQNYADRPDLQQKFPGAWYSVQPIEPQRIQEHHYNPWYFDEPKTMTDELSGREVTIPPTPHPGWDPERYGAANWKHPMDARGIEHRLWHEQGGWGRGLIDPSGPIYTWPEEEATHAQRARSLDLDPFDYERHFEIDPQGQFRMHLLPGKVAPDTRWHDYIQTGTDLRPGDWSQGQKVLTKVGRPSKFYTDLDDHEAGKRRHHHGWHFKQAMINPEWLHNEYIVRRGPYLYHQTHPVAAQRILQEGLYPHDIETPTDEFGQLSDPMYRSRSKWAGEFYRPRPGHVYLGEPTRCEQSSGGAGWTHQQDGQMLKVDLRQLDPSKINPDEDFFMENPQNMIAQSVIGEHPIPDSEGFVTGQHGTSLGDWAEAANLGKHHDETQASLMRHGAIAYNGIIPPEAISLHNPEAEAQNRWL